MELQIQLKELYACRWDGLKEALREIVDDEEERIKPAYPFLLSLACWENGEPNEDWYGKADVKVMVFGQETNGWKGNPDDTDDFGPSPIFDPEISMEAVMGIYENFYASHYTGDGFNYNGNKYGTFHYGASRLIELLNARFAGKKVAYLWNDIVKIGRAGGSGFCGDRIYTVEHDYFPVVRKEVGILKPDLILFLTGGYDNRIRDCFGEICFTPLDGFPEQEVARVILPGIDVPAFRTCHPSSWVKKELKEQYYRAIVEHV